MKTVSEYNSHNELISVTKEDLLEAMSKTYDLAYIEYDDDLGSSLEELQKSIHFQDDRFLWESLETDWLDENRIDSCWEIQKQLQEDMSDSENYSTVELFFEENGYEIQDIIYSRDSSTPLKDLIRNTGELVFFYDLELDIECTYCGNKEELAGELEEIKEALQITDNRYDDKLDLMQQQASYGGKLVIYFRHNIDYMLDVEDNNTIEFQDPIVAITDSMNGSGDHTTLEGHSLKVSLDTKNIFIDKLIKYSYTYDTCMMSSSWCDKTRVSLSRETKGDLKC